jgi:hypothetical protein
MADSFSTTSHNSWGGRIVSSLVGVIVGILFIPGSIFLLSWNEHRAITTTHSLKEGAAAVVDISADKIDSANDGKLVHVTGPVTTRDGVSDSTFAVSAPALRLHRMVEMYQWKETQSSEEKKNLGGSTETVTTYKYEKEWSGSLIDSSDFKQPEGHGNPTEMIESETFKAQDAQLGAFAVPEAIIDMMDGDKALAPTQENFDGLSGALKESGHLTSGGYYFGKNPEAAIIGDQKVTFEVLKTGTFSILAQQNSATFQPYATKAGDEIERVESGAVDAKLMFQHAQGENTIITWLLRLAGLVLMWIGFGLIFKPLSVLADVIPFLGSIVGAGGGFVALLIAMVGTFTTIAIAWLVVRPLLGGSLLIAAAAALFFAWRAATSRLKKAS